MGNPGVVRWAAERETVEGWFAWASGRPRFRMSSLSLLLPSGNEQQALFVSALVVGFGILVTLRYLWRIGGVTYHPGKRYREVVAARSKQAAAPASASPAESSAHRPAASEGSRPATRSSTRQRKPRL